MLQKHQFFQQKRGWEFYYKFATHTNGFTTNILLIVVVAFIEMPVKAIVTNVAFVASNNTPCMIFAIPHPKN